MLLENHRLSYILTILPNPTLTVIRRQITAALAERNCSESTETYATKYHELDSKDEVLLTVVESIHFNLKFLPDTYRTFSFIFTVLLENHHLSYILTILPNPILTVVRRQHGRPHRTELQ